MAGNPNAHHLPPSFCVVLLRDFMHTLVIPGDFVKSHLKGDTVENSILKTCGSSRSWAVSIEKVGEDHVFKTGWSDFVVSNGLERGDFLLFQLSSDATFVVSVYDPTCCEKPKPLDCADERIVRVEKDAIADEAVPNPRHEASISKSCETRIHLSMKFVRETGLLLTANHTVLRDERGRTWRVETCVRRNGRLFELTEGWKDFRSENGIEESDVCSFEFCRAEGNLIDVRVLRKNHNTGSRRRKRAEEKTVSVEDGSRQRKRADENTVSAEDGSRQGTRVDDKTVSAEDVTPTENPCGIPEDVTPTENPCGEVRIPRRKRSRINLPVKFVRETGALLKAKHTVLRNERGREWRVEICMRYGGRMFELTKGWPDFRNGNGLEESDVCLLEFRRDEDNVIAVRVLKNNKKRITGANEKSVGREDGTRPTNPRCEVRMPESRRTRINLPIGFVRETGALLKKKDTVLRNEQGREWTVGLCVRNGGTVYELTWGWKDFRDGNGLEESDVCSLEFRRDEGNVIDVRVLRRRPRRHAGANKKIVQGKRKATHAKTKNPCFVSTIRGNNIYTKGLGIAFVRETGVLLRKKDVVIRDEEGRRWAVDTRRYKDHRNYVLTSGWKALRIANGLEIGDVCSFEYLRDQRVIGFRVLRRNREKAKAKAKSKTQR